MSDQVVASQTVADSAEKLLISAIKNQGVNLILLDLGIVPASPLGWLLTQFSNIVIDNIIEPCLKEVARDINVAIINTEVDKQVDAVKKATTLDEAIHAFENLS